MRACVRRPPHVPYPQTSIMKHIIKIAFLFALICICRCAAAHFLWLEASPTDKPSTVNLWFSETCAPGEAKLLDKAAHTKAWVSTPSGTAQSLTLEKKDNGDTGSWSSSIEAKSPCSIDAMCDYGVVTRGGETFLLQYDARHLVIGRGEDLASAGASDALALQVRPHWKGNSLSLSVMFDGKPATDAQLLAILPNNEEQELKLDSSGVGAIEHPAAGDYAFRARVQQKQSGQRDGKQYDQVRHYSTLTFRLPKSVVEPLAVADASAPSPAATAAKSAPAAKKAPDAAAVDLLNRARANRAVWEHFPGFSASVTVRIDDTVEKGTVGVDEHGTVTSQLKNDKLRDWIDEQLGSLVDHRMPSVPEDEQPTLADDDVNHPLGRLIRLGDAKYDSSYRIRDDMVTEVNRRAGPDKFSISVFETDRSKEGKYLPRTFSATYWDAKSGEIKSSSSYLNTWKRVGAFDLPDRFLEVETLPGERHVKEITFHDYSLHEKSK